MTVLDRRTDPPVTRRRDAAVLGLGLIGLALAVTIRVRVAGSDGARSVPAGIVFGLILFAIAAAGGLERPTWRWSSLAWGMGGAAALCLAPFWRRLGHDGVSGAAHQFTVWAVVVTMVAVAEEVLLRGSLFEAAVRYRGENAAIAVSAVAFALLHVPVYGWSVLPLDLAVGVALGVLRVLAGSVTAPALTHVVADLAGWWLR
jgi:membrane protease YdiL (CAAX protease family)